MCVVVDLYVMVRQALLDMSKEHFDITDEDIADMTDIDKQEFDLVTRTVMKLVRAFSTDQIDRALQFFSVSDSDRTAYLSSFLDRCGV